VARLLAHGGTRWLTSLFWRRYRLTCFRTRSIEWRDASKAERDPEFVEQLRSPLARYDWSGSEGGGWAVYWIVENLRRLDEPVRLDSLRLPDGRRLSPAFIPRGPIRVQTSE
jgi:hypothetical protein